MTDLSVLLWLTLSAALICHSSIRRYVIASAAASAISGGLYCVLNSLFISHGPSYHATIFLYCSILTFPASLIIGIPFALVRRPPRPIDPRYCRNCKYDLRGNVSGICPECGTAVGTTV